MAKNIVFKSSNRDNENNKVRVIDDKKTVYKIMIATERGKDKKEIEVILTGLNEEDAINKARQFTKLMCIEHLGNRIVRKIGNGEKFEY